MNHMRLLHARRVYTCGNYGRGAKAGTQAEMAGGRSRGEMVRVWVLKLEIANVRKELR